ncbi:MAG: hypothetical protein EAZ81_07845 [Verrucomicrobia bacterium]|nr:MAG: hypothetical protein EAZ81_07845 [Verrucomicrobiota bacterium]
MQCLSDLREPIEQFAIDRAAFRAGVSGYFQPVAESGRGTEQSLISSGERCLSGFIGQLLLRFLAERAVGFAELGLIERQILRQTKEGKRIHGA